MSELGHGGATNPVITAGLANSGSRQYGAFQSGRTVLLEQQVALESVLRRSKRRCDQTLTDFDRSRLMDLAVRVLSHAMIHTEAECRRIVAAAEVRATTIVEDACNEVAKLSPSRQSVVPGRGCSSSHLTVEPETAGGSGAVVPDRDSRAIQTDESGYRDGGVLGATIGDAFFESFPEDEQDRWSFMDDDNMVGVGPGILRRVLRRPMGARRRSSEDGG